jgi:hypothetical protein
MLLHEDSPEAQMASWHPQSHEQGFRLSWNSDLFSPGAQAGPAIMNELEQVETGVGSSSTLAGSRLSDIPRLRCSVAVCCVLCEKRWPRSIQRNPEGWIAQNLALQ